MLANEVVSHARSLDHDFHSEVYRLLMSGHSGVMVTRAGALEGIVTRIDLVNFWEATRSPSPLVATEA